MPQLQSPMARDAEALSLESISSRIQSEMAQLMSDLGKSTISSVGQEKPVSKLHRPAHSRAESNISETSAEVTAEPTEFQRRFPAIFPIHEMLECDPPQIKQAASLIDERVQVLRKRFEHHTRVFQKKWTRREKEHEAALQWSIHHREQRLREQ
ncbi:hypothetical protein J8273_4301 [Carpediemonas membranifera]|uniref:Uncharacterized protein n=1 Tax=Carpediemonas membranifera TaxID=201153 RepID=A0A8J6B6N3_9EUKA|nr:hypothetical protein J8273_4301 [Carpediemonas membranifera]|eukprot:KAG9394199.1 hypothetical protein J8273_4301 [Carpediemonas membranifera]